MGVIQQLTVDLIAVLFMSLLWISPPGLSFGMFDTNAYRGELGGEFVPTELLEVWGLTLGIGGADSALSPSRNNEREG